MFCIDIRFFVIGFIRNLEITQIGPGLLRFYILYDICRRSRKTDVELLYDGR